MKLEKDFYNSPRWSTEILDCSMPMSFDTYSNCAHQCVYCFAYFQRAVGMAKDDYLAHRVKAVSTQRIKNMFSDPDKYAGQFAWYIKSRFVLQWGGLSDGFDWYERLFGKSLELLAFFREIDYPISISTKGVWWIDDERYQRVISGWKNLHIKISIITTDEEKSKLIEPGTPSVAERFLGLRKLKDMGIYTTTRFRPFIIGVSNLTVEDIFLQSSLAGVDSITTEFLCLEKRAKKTAKERFAIISKACGFDIYEYYRRLSIQPGLMRLNYETKRTYIEQMISLAKKYGLKFFVSDAHHKAKSFSCNCCGLPTDGETQLVNSFKGHYAEALQIAKKNGVVHWGDIADNASGLKNIRYQSIDGYNTGTTRNRAKYKFSTMFDYARIIWNSPLLFISPSRYFDGVLKPTGLDAEKDIIYEYVDK